MRLFRITFQDSCRFWLLAATFLIPLADVRAQEDDLARELPRIPAVEPDKASGTFAIHQGFSLVQSAVEPLVADPVSMIYDARGRAYVVEMRGYPFPEERPTGKVRLLVDGDSDGIFEKGTDFLTGLDWPTSVLPYKDGVFVTAPPEIIYARDDNGDGIADTRKVMFSGFGTQNVQALLNGLVWGTDGWIYCSGGGNGGDIKNHVTGKVTSIRGRDFRFRPDGSAFEPISGGGQFGHSLESLGGLCAPGSEPQTPPSASVPQPQSWSPPAFSRLRQASQFIAAHLIQQNIETMPLSAMSAGILYTARSWNEPAHTIPPTGPTRMWNLSPQPTTGSGP
jgi:putative membrane-bound dehydrogenase-like protein